LEGARPTELFGFACSVARYEYWLFQPSLDCLHHELRCSSDKQIRLDLLKGSFPLVTTTSRSLFLFPAAGGHGRRNLRGEILAKHEGCSSFLSLFCNCAVTRTAGVVSYLKRFCLEQDSWCQISPDWIGMGLESLLCHCTTIRAGWIGRCSAFSTSADWSQAFGKSR
jgi:hypothetical protein